MRRHCTEPAMNRTTHLLAQRAVGAAWQWARSIGGMGKGSAGRPASPI
jgi:hypothetical protein